MKTIKTKYKPEYSIIEFGVDEISLAPSSNPRLLETNPGGNDSGPDGDGKCLLMPATPVGLPPIPGDGARLGGVERPKPESVSSQQCECDYGF